MIATRNKILFQDLGRMDYQEAWDVQEDIFQNTIARKIENRKLNEDQRQETNNHLIFCEHSPVYTLGKSGMIENLLLNNHALKEKGIQFFKNNRGGDITYHGPGQIVGYPIIDLEHYFTDIGRYLRGLEQSIIDTLLEYGLEGDRLKGATGVWLDPDDPVKARKICAIGVRASRWVTMHGFAFNVNTDLDYFNHIVPCGIQDKGVTSLANEMGHPIDMEEVKSKLLSHFGNVFESEIIKT